MNDAPMVIDRLGTLGDLTRARLLSVVEEGEHTVTELCQVLQAPQSTVSGHLRVLADAGWVDARSQGKRRLYRLAGGLDSEARSLWEVVRAGLVGSAIRNEDAERARAVRAARVDRARDYFSRTAERWDEVRVELYGRWSQHIPLLGLLEPHWTVADLGCGTGTFAGMVAPFVRCVHAVDRSREMLDSARTRLGDRLHPRGTVRLHQGDLAHLPLDDGEADLAVMNLVLHFLPEPERALAEAARVLRPGGRLVVVEMRPHDRVDVQEAMGHLWAGFPAPRLAGWMDDSGLCDVRVHDLPPDPEARGPLLQMAAGRAPSRSRKR
jgi:ArsR family transcriptional regulator